MSPGFDDLRRSATTYQQVDPLIVDNFSGTSCGLTHIRSQSRGNHALNRLRDEGNLANRLTITLSTACGEVGENGAESVAFRLTGDGILDQGNDTVDRVLNQHELLVNLLKPIQIL